MQRIYVSLCMALALLAMKPASAQLVLAHNGTTTYQIVVPAKAAATETKAATVLQRYFKAVTGAAPAIVPETAFKGDKGIYIGAVSKAAATAWKEDAYGISVSGNALLIGGAKGKGVLYGVYAFIEQFLDCRKYDAGPAETPKLSDVTMPANTAINVVPAFRYRESYNPPAFDDEYLDWHQLQRFEILWGLWGHSYFKLVSPALYFKTHPEYFAQVNGQRQATQLCLSNPQVLRIVIDQLRLKMQDNPDASYWSVGPNDEGGYCTCPLCSKADAEEGGPQGSLIRFVNKVATAFPDRYITTLGYGYTSKAPLKTRPAANVFIFVSSIDAYRDQPLTAAASAAGFRANLRDWSAVTGNIFVWDYATQFTAYLAPFPAQQNLAPDYRYFLDQKVKGVFEQGSGDTYSDMAELNTWLQARLLRDPQADPVALQQEFCTGYYGKGAPFVLQYLERRRHALTTSGRRLDIYGDPIAALRSYLSPELIDTYDQLLEQAETATTDTRYQQRIQRIRLGLDYAVLQQARHFGADAHGFLEDKGGATLTVRPEYTRKLSNFVAAATNAGVKELSEGGLSPVQYQAEWQELFRRSWPKNIAAGIPVQLAQPYAEDYPAKGLNTLTDAMTGFTDFSYNWLCFYGVDMTATLDLKKSTSWNKISINFLDDQRHWIFLPSELRVETSDDGVQYKAYGTPQTIAPAENNKVQIRNFQFSGKATARYIRVIARNPGVLPPWRAHPSKKPMIACDEVMVN